MIDKEQILYLERLARIELDETQRALFRKELSRILEYMERLSQVDSTTPVHAAFSQPLGLRTDEEQPSLDRESLLSGSPGATEDCMTVPRAVQ